MAIYTVPGKIRRKPGPKKTQSIPEILVREFEVGLGHPYLQSFTGNSRTASRPNGTDS